MFFPEKKGGKNEEVRLKKKYDLFRCTRQKGDNTTPCGGLMIAKSGQKTSKCIKCGARSRLSSCRLVAQADKQKDLRERAKKLGGML